MTGNGAFLASNQGITFTFLKPPERARADREVAGEMMGKLGAIPGVFAFLRPFPVLEISTGATNQNQGQYAFSVSGVNPDQVYEAAGKLMAKLAEYPGFATVSSDFFNNTPNLDIDLRRDQAKTYGVSESAHPVAPAQRLLAELRLPDQEARTTSTRSSSRWRTRRGPIRRTCRCSTSGRTTARTSSR